MTYCKKNENNKIKSRINSSNLGTILKYFFILTYSIIILVSCKQEVSLHLQSNADSPELHEEKSTLTSENVKSDARLVAITFTKRLRENQPLAPLFRDRIAFAYQEENRCTGSTTGKVDGIHSELVDSRILIKVRNDSKDAWACEPKDSYYFEMGFTLSERIKQWDRFELQADDYSPEESKGENTFYILGAGESDYIKIEIESGLIHTLTYGSEDPG